MMATESPSAPRNTTIWKTKTASNHQRQAIHNGDNIAATLHDATLGLRGTLGTVHSQSLYSLPCLIAHSIIENFIIAMPHFSDTFRWKNALNSLHNCNFSLIAHFPKHTHIRAPFVFTLYLQQESIVECGISRLSRSSALSGTTGGVDVGRVSISRSQLYRGKAKRIQVQSTTSKLSPMCQSCFALRGNWPSERRCNPLLGGRLWVVRRKVE